MNFFRYTRSSFSIKGMVKIFLNNKRFETFFSMKELILHLKRQLSELFFNANIKLIIYGKNCKEQGLLDL